MEDSFAKYVCAGYFLVKRSAAGGTSSLVPPAILTLSSCFACTVPAWWAFRWCADEKKRAAGLEACGLKDRPAEFLNWVTERESRRELLFPNVICTLNVARQLVVRFLIQTRDWHLLGLGLNRSLRESFLNEFKPARAMPGAPFDSETPLYEMLLETRELESGARILGYDVLGPDAACTIHSWLCNGLETRAHWFGIHVNSLGLLDKYIDAEKIAQDANDPGTGAEPVPWYPWIVVEYPT